MATLIVRLRGLHRGQIVAAVEDGHRFGLREGLPDFGKVHLPGLATTRLKRFAARNEGEGAWKRHWRFRFLRVPLALRERMTTTGEIIVGVDVSLAKLKQALYHQRDLIDASGIDVS